MFNYMGRNAKWLALSYLLWGVGEGLWIYIQSLYIAELGATPEQSGLVIGLNSLIKVLIYLPAGWLGDRFGPRRVMLPAWIVGTTGVIGIALAPDWRWLVPAFVVYGMSGAAVPLSAAYLSRAMATEAKEHPRQTFGRVLTTLSAGFSAGLIFAPGLGGWLGERVTLRAAFLFSALWFILSTLAAAQTKPMPPVPRKADAPGYGELFRQRWLVLSMLAVVLTLAAVSLVTPIGTAPQTFLEEERDLEAGVIGLLGSINAAGSALLSLWLGCSDKPLRAFMAALALMWGGSGLLLISHHVIGLGLVYVMWGGFGVVRPLIESVIVPRVREDQRGVLLALVEALCALGVAAGIWSGGRLYTHSGPKASFVLALVALPITGALCWLILRPGEQSSAALQPTN